MESLQVDVKNSKKKGILKTLKYIGKTLITIICTILIFIIIISCITIFDATTHPGKTPSALGYKDRKSVV